MPNVMVRMSYHALWNQKETEAEIRSWHFHKSLNQDAGNNLGTNSLWLKLHTTHNIKVFHFSFSFKYNKTNQIYVSESHIFNVYTYIYHMLPDKDEEGRDWH